MKKLLSTLAIAVIGSSSGSLLVNSFEISQRNDTFAKEFSWNPVGQIEIRQARSQGHGLWTQDPQMTRALYTFNLGTEANFSHFTFLNPNIATVIWGNNSMGRWQLPNFDFVFDEDHNQQLTDIDDINFFPYLKYQLFDETYSAVFATLVARTHLGYTWFFQNNNYYFQFLLFEYINVKSDFSAAYSETNLGMRVSFS